jgi:hypothetical protein
MHLNWLCHRSEHEEREREKGREMIFNWREEKENKCVRVLMIIEFDNNSMFIRVTLLIDQKSKREKKRI